VKNLLLSYYGFEIEMKGIPDQYKKELEALIWDFIWEGKVNQIKTGPDRMVVGFTTTYAISAYHH
jgi:hypothetical protein